MENTKKTKKKKNQYLTKKNNQKHFKLIIF